MDFDSTEKGLEVAAELRHQMPAIGVLRAALREGMGPPEAHHVDVRYPHVCRPRGLPCLCGHNRKGSHLHPPRASVRRALPLHLPSGFLGPPLESHGYEHPPPRRLRTRQVDLHPLARAEMGPAACGLLDLRRVGADARADFLLHREEGSHVGGHVLLLTPRRVHCGGDWAKESD